MIHMRWHHIRKQWHWILATVVLTIVLVTFTFQGQFFFSVAQKFQDSFLLTADKTSQTIFIVKIDDKSLEKLGVFPWPRSYHASLIKLLDQAKPKVIGYDVAFFEKSSHLDHDLALSQSLKDISTPIVLPEELHQISNNSALSHSAPLPELLGPNVTTGFINVFPDQDLIIRHFSPQLSLNNIPVPSFADAVAQHSDMAKKPEIPTATAYLPITNMAQYPAVSFVDVLEGKVPVEIFRDKIVLIGSTAATLHDEVLLPYQANTTPGVYLHALYIDAILANKSFNEIPPLITLTLIFCLVLIIFAAKLFLPASLDWPINISLLVIITLLPFLLVQQYWLAPLFYLYFTWLIATIASSILKTLLIEKEREQLKKHFELYVNKSVVHELIKNPSRAVLGGDKREMTVLFSDIRSFTSISEQMSPQEVVQFLNEYLDMMTEIVLAQDGVLDKYIGDAIMAFWGAPLPQADHAVRGVRTAWQMQKMMKERGESILRNWPKLGKLKIGIGLNSGPMAVGNMGSRLRFDYTVIGDNVNTASRIEGLTKYWRADILFPESTKLLVEHEFLCRELDLVKVKGRNEPLRLFDVLEESTKADASLKAALRLFEEGLHCYRDGQFDNAMLKFRSWQAERPEDAVVEVFIERCQDFLAHPQKAKGFSGVIVMESK
ncbi:MAG: adenylate/guanylate cyclase domain-containing protein [Candidatus Abawacabacteria bacterium]|nr:adenylate/guanylate cyclase domain-containing protein [Candidatus Abawacabacteria bacterium]